MTRLTSEAMQHSTSTQLDPRGADPRAEADLAASAKRRGLVVAARVEDRARFEDDALDRTRLRVWCSDEG